jgi:RNA polymerase sigma-70 factor (ECF subfamily)
VSELLRHARPPAVGNSLDLHAPLEPEEGLTPERILSGRQELDRLYRAIMRLAEPARTIFVMRKIDNLPQKVIADRLRVSEHVVENHVARGLRMILLQIAKEDDAPQDERPARQKRGATDARNS